VPIRVPVSFRFCSSLRSLVRGTALFAPALALLLVSCEGKRELREWQPSDHQPPPTVAPEGQGAGAGDAPESQEQSNARAAASLWESRCASCHGVDGGGNGPGKPPGAQLPDMTLASYRTARTDAELHTIIKNGRGMMPAFATQLTDLGIDALVTHVRTLARAP
jgi:mono/diheme cytochrome c family protein